MKKSLEYLLILSCVVLLGIAQQSEAAIYYVDQSAGADTNNGSQSTPWKNMPGSMQTNNSGYLANNWVKLQTGDTLIVKAGTYNHRWVINSTYYSSGVTVQRDTASGSAIIDGTGLTFGSYDSLVFIDKVADLTIDGLTAAGFTVQNSPMYGLRAWGNSEAIKTTGLKVYFLKAYNNGYQNILVQKQQNFHFNNIEVNGNSKTGGYQGGFYFGDDGGGNDNGLVENATSHHNGSPPGSSPGGNNVYIGFWITNSTNLTFKNCQAYANAGRGFDIGTVGSVSTTTDNIKVFNSISHNNSVGFGANLEDISGTARVFFVNTIATNNGMGYDIYNGISAYIYNSIAAFNGTGFYGASQETTGAYANRYYYAEIKNTIFYMNTTNDVEQFNINSLYNSIIPMDYNYWGYGKQAKAVYWNDSTVYDPYFYNTSSAPGGTSRSWYTKHGQDAHSLNSIDGKLPQFVSAVSNSSQTYNYDFNLQSTSNLLGKGTQLTTYTYMNGKSPVTTTLPSDVAVALTVDMNGYKRPTPMSIGPYEYAGTTPTPPPARSLRELIN
ncbi:hypothetical protein [Geomobilimonas luticola]|uniref:Uncharacterized protein n=1 Tax=Geomobilimonas luticola TaxID=1114878 RepID=A0ABS5SC45_9BACT|nr:hypothetical protein [Geomobilimonas luticola]MBT0652938.1 hypothetical protein [Geomobilimonas luticola]